MLWSTVSNVALISSSTSNYILPESEWKQILFIILMSAVSVLWCARKPDWKLSRYPFEFKYLFSWLKTTFSIILPMKGRFDIGLKLLNVVLSRSVTLGQTTLSFLCVLYMLLGKHVVFLPFPYATPTCCSTSLCLYFLGMWDFLKAWQVGGTTAVSHYKNHFPVTSLRTLAYTCSGTTLIFVTDHF